MVTVQHGDGLAPVFAIGLRADDAAVLDDLCREWGGGVYFVAGRDEAQKPKALWRVTGKADLLQLVAYFDRFPLRAKKRHDFAIWRRAVGVYVEQGYLAPELQVLREALASGRVYNEAKPQLRLAG